MSQGRFREEQSRINCVRKLWVGLESSLLFGKLAARVLRRSGIILVLVSEVDLHRVSRCSMSSAGAGWSK